MKKAALLAAAIGWWAGLAAAQTTQPTLEQSLFVKSLTHSARSLIDADSTPSRAGAWSRSPNTPTSLSPRDEQAMSLMTDIYQLQGDMKSAAELVLKRLDAQHEDYVLGLLYLDLGVSAADAGGARATAPASSAKARLDFLEGVAGNEKQFTAYIRAEALARAAQVLLGQGDRKAATAKLEEAIKLDPNHSSVVAGLLGLREGAKLPQRAQTLMQLIQANPNDTNAAWDLATLLDSLGMADKALPFYDYAWTLTVRQTPEALNESMAVKYLNGLLDAGAAQKAIEVFVPLRKKLGDTAEIISLLAEAYAQVGQGEKASAMLNDLKLQLSDRESLQGKSPQALEECAWYYLINNVYPNAALGYARKAAKDMRDVDPGMELVLGAAELRAGDATAGEKVLKKLLDRDIYAAMFLAQYYYENRKPDDGKRAILMGAKLSQPGQRGRAFRAGGPGRPPERDDPAAGRGQGDRRDGRKVRLRLPGHGAGAREVPFG